MIFQVKTASASLLRGGLSNFGVLQTYFSLNSLDQITEFYQVSAAASMSTSGIDIRVLFTGTVLIFVELLGPLDTYIFGYFFFRLLSLNF